MYHHRAIIVHSSHQGSIVLESQPRTATPASVVCVGDCIIDDADPDMKTGLEARNKGDYGILQDSVHCVRQHVYGL